MARGAARTTTIRAGPRLRPSAHGCADQVDLLARVLAGARV
ncbi:hypothetical protein [Georgenia sp. SUBG003]